MAEDPPGQGGVSSPGSPQDGIPVTPTPWGPAPAPWAPQPGQWGPAPGPWGPPPGAWAPQPWWPAPVITPPPDLLEPRLRHPRTSRSTFGLQGRAAPRLYAAGWILSVASLAALSGLIVAAM